MSRSKLFFMLVFLASFLARSGRAQQPAAVPERPSAPAASITGFVYDAESRLPVRFAEINIVPVSSDADEQEQVLKPGESRQRLPRVSRAYGVTGMDGSFRVDGIPAGDYLVAAIKPGYVPQVAAVAMDPFLAEDRFKEIIASLLQVHVGNGQIASVSLTLQRGAVISGRMQFADGSPVIGATVGIETIESDQRFEAARRPENRSKVVSPRYQALQGLMSSQGRTPNIVTDDEGRYRIAGLAPGKYLVSTILALDHNRGRIEMSRGVNPYSTGREHMYPEMISVFAPQTVSRKDAKIFEVHGEDQITDADLTINSSGVHTIRGKVFSVADRHVPPSTYIYLKQAGLEGLPRGIEVEDDGSFQVNYLPPGSYTLQILSRDNPNPANTTFVAPTEYKTVNLTAVVMDHDVVLDDVLLVPLKPGEHNTAPGF